MVYTFLYTPCFNPRTREDYSLRRTSSSKYIYAFIVYIVISTFGCAHICIAITVSIALSLVLYTNITSP